MNVPLYKIVIAGDAGVGKTTFVNKLMGRDFQYKHIPTIGAEVHPISFQTTNGGIVLNIWDTAGYEKYSGLRENYYKDADAVILMFDIGSSVSRSRSENYWYPEVIKYAPPNTQIVVVATKHDIHNKSGPAVSFVDNNIAYYKISSKTDKEILQPVLYIIRTLLNDNTINFVEKKIPSSPKSDSEVLECCENCGCPF